MKAEQNCGRWRGEEALHAQRSAGGAVGHFLIRKRFYVNPDKVDWSLRSTG